MKVIGIMIALLSSSAFASNYINLYFIKSPLKIRWKSPQSLALSTAINSIVPVRNDKYRHPISHVYAEIKCQADSDSPIHLYGGMTTADDNEANKLLFQEKIGLGILYYLQKGRLQREQEIVDSIEYFKGKRRLNRLSVKVSEASCLRVAEFYEGWLEKGYDKLYAGFNAVPRNGEGSGCAEYATSLLDVAGVLDEEFKKAWSFKITPPYDLVGPPMTNNEVDFVGVLTSFGKKWETEETDLTLEAWDPGVMHRWVKKVHRKLRKKKYKGSLPFKILNFNDHKNKGLIVDLSDRPTPTDPIWND